MDAASVRERIVALFEKHRAKPGAAYDEDHFLDFLMAAPQRRHAVYDSLRGLRRFNAFIDEVQYEFAICFSQRDREANYSLPKFVERVIGLQGSPQGSLRSLKNHIRASSTWSPIVFLDVVFLILAVVLKGYVWAVAALGCVAVFLNVKLIRFVLRENAYLERLQSRIEATR